VEQALRCVENFVAAFELVLGADCACSEDHGPCPF
jgi:hypothetical protein